MRTSRLTRWVIRGALAVSAAAAVGVIAQPGAQSDDFSWGAGSGSEVTVDSPVTDDDASTTGREESDFSWG